MVYLAMTAAEFRCASQIPPNIAWMACHFSPYGTALTNLPRELPPGSLLILNDRTPIHGHDPAQVFDILTQAVEELGCAGLLLDLQRPNCGEAAKLAEKLMDLPCPVCVSEIYGKDLDCPVLLPPVPLLQSVEEYIAPWGQREIWLELALDGIEISVTENGSTTAPLPHYESPEIPHCDMQLHCHYGIKMHQNRADFVLKRTKNDLQNMTNSAEKAGITHFVGLWQELGEGLSAEI